MVDDGFIKEVNRILRRYGNIQVKYIRCGKKNCKSCPHGPYFYEFKRKGKKVKSIYRGKTLPEYYRTLDAVKKLLEDYEKAHRELNNFYLKKLTMTLEENPDPLYLQLEVRK